jgi:RpiR family carbohydrate utilization transcriptional regulator
MQELKLNPALGFMMHLNSVSSKLSVAEKKAAEYIQSNKEEIIHLSIAEVADRSRTSEASVIRLCKRLGYKGFQHIKISLAKEVVGWTHQIHEAIGAEDSIGTIKKKIFQANIQALYDSMEVCEDKEIEKAIEAIRRARHIEMYGNGASGAVALDAQHKLLKLGIKSYVYLDVFLQSMSASVLSEKDVVMAISHTGANKDVIHAVKLDKDQGATIIAITNFSKSPLTRLADIHLYTAANETLFRTDAIASRLAQLTIIDTLFAGIANYDYETYLKVIEKTRNSTINRKF